MMNWKSFGCILLIFTSVQCGNVIFEDCGSAYELDSVLIEGCERSVPCHLTLGAPTKVSVLFNAGFISTALSQEVNVVLNNVQREIVVSPEACKATWCPVSVSDISVYDAVLELPTNLALNTRGVLNWQLFNEDRVNVICFSVTIQTQGPY